MLNQIVTNSEILLKKCVKLKFKDAFIVVKKSVELKYVSEIDLAKDERNR